MADSSMNEMPEEFRWVPPLWDELPDGEASKRRAELQRRLRGRDLAEILSTPAGQRFFKDMMILCGVFSEAFKGNASTYYDQGCRAVGLRYWNLVGEVDKDLQKDISPPYDDWPYAERQD